MLIIVAIVVIALVFDYINGFHDAANSIATIVSTRVLTPRQAVVWAGFFNFIAFTVFPLHVAHTIGKGIIDPKIITDAVLLGALGGAIAWNLITWWYGLPSSSSHALVGGLLGAGISKGGFAVVQQSGVLKTAIFIVVSPVLGMVLGGGMMVLVAWVFRRKQPGRIDRWFRRLQLVSSALFSLGHGANDAQKTMGIIMAMLIAKGKIGPHAELPLWVILSCQSAMGLGTLTGGWRIVRTMGMRLTKLKPSGGFCAETGAAAHALPGQRARRPGVDHAHHHRRHRRRGLGEQAGRRALGRGAADRLGLALHHPVGGAHRGRALLRPARAGRLAARSFDGCGRGPRGGGRALARRPPGAPRAP